MDRKLAAILAADVVGYSALMERDEKGTFERLKGRRSEVFEPQVKTHHGRIFKLMGDGVMAEFPSVVDALECAVAVQKDMLKRNNDLAQDQRLDLRIGINLGDVIVEGRDRHGEGVNIAARLEQLAEPGGICVSRSAYDQAKNKFAFESKGEHKFKNIAEPIPVYCVKLDGMPVRRTLPRQVPRWPWAAVLALVIAVAAGLGVWLMEAGTPARAKPGLAVLPFTNFTGGEAGGRLADGITEDIITDLARFKELDVIAHNSTMVYKGKPVDIRQVGRDLDVAYVLEGSVQAEKDRVRVTGQLIDAETGAHVWANRWDRPSADLFAVQSEVSEAVAAALGGSLNIGAVNQSEVAKMRSKAPASLQVYDLFLIGLEAKSKRTRDSVAAGLTALDKAIALDPGFARAYTARGWLHYFSTEFGVPWKDGIQRMGADMKKGVELEPGNSNHLASLGAYYAVDANTLPQTDSLLHEALALNSNDIHTLMIAASYLPYVGYPEKAAAMADRLNRLDPRMQVNTLLTTAEAYFYARRFEDTVKAVVRMNMESRSTATRLFFGASLAFLGHKAEAEQARATVLALRPDITAQQFQAEGWHFARQQEEDLFFEAFRVLNLPMCATPEQLKDIAKPKPLPECPAAKS